MEQRCRGLRGRDLKGDGGRLMRRRRKAPTPLAGAAAIDASEDIQIAGGDHLAIVIAPKRPPLIKKLAVTLPVSGGPIGIVKARPATQLFTQCAREVAKTLAK